MLRKLLVVYLVYLGLCLLVILPGLNILAPWLVNKHFDRTLSTEIILFNPFTLAVEVRRAALPEKNGESFAGFSSAELNLSLESLWSSGLVLDALRLEGLYVEIRRSKNGSFNFSDLLPPTDSSAPPQAPSSGESSLPGLTVGDLFIQAPWIKFSDEGREKPFSTQLDGLEIAVRDLSTVREEGKPYTLDVRGEAGGQLHWEGVISVPGAYSSGSLALSNISLLTASRFLEPWVAFELTDGRLNVAGQYEINWDDGLKYLVNQGEISLVELVIGARETAAIPDTGVSLGALQVSGLTVEGAGELVDIESIAINDLGVSAWSEGSQVSLATLLTPKQTADTPQEPAAESNWQVRVAQTSVSDSYLNWRSEFTDPSTLLVSPLDITVSNLAWPPRGETQVDLNLAVNDAARLSAAARLDLAGGGGVINYSLSELPAHWFNPNLPKSVNAAIAKGQIEAKGDLALIDFAPARLSMDGAIRDFSISVHDTESAITNWKSVRWQQLAIDLSARQLVLQELSVDGYSGRLHIFEDGTFNAQRVLREEGEAPGSAAEVDEGEPAQPWSFSVPKVTITDSALDFMDETLPITFRTVIGDLNGLISGISSDPDSEARVDLDGSVDGYAPVKLTGTAKPLRSPPALDLALNFDGVDLARLSPYSGTYVGHAIDRGILNLDLKYTLDKGRLDGSNEIVINRLKLGRKVASEKAVDLPLKLAIALLTDLNGVIDLSVPVSGNMDDPKFSLGSVIFSTLFNILTKAVTAPFNLLASLIGSDDDLQRVTFASGSAELDETGKTKLNELSTALQQRPELILVLSGKLHPRADRESLQKSALRAQLLADGLSEADWQSRGPAWSDAIAARYASANAAEENEVSLSEKVKRLVAAMPVSEAALHDLAERRAVETKRYLVNEAQLSGDRAVIEKSKPGGKEQLFSGVEMKIDF